MRVLYSGGTICSFETMQRLVLLADEIGFMDRPSVTVGNFGTVGRQSEARRLSPDDAPIKFSTHPPPGAPRADLYRRYIDADLEDNNFIRIVLDGLKGDVTFQERLVQLEANYGWGTGRQVLQELLKDQTLYEGRYSSPSEPKLLYVPDTQEGRRQTLGSLLIEASIQVTNALITAESTGLSPVSDDPFLCQLIALRASDFKYVAQHSRTASLLGLEVSKAVLPSESLSRLTMKDLFEFRSAAKDSYAAWSQELERMGQRLLDIPAERFGAEAAGLIVNEVRPRMVELRHEMVHARDKLFGDLVKTVTRWEVPTLSIAYLTSLSLPTALAAFAGALAPAVPALVDYYVERRDITRKNSMAYLVGVTKLADQ